MSSLFSPIPTELAVVSQIFSQADPEMTGVLTGDISQRNIGMSLPRTPSPTPFPPLTAQDKARFHRMFIASNHMDSLMSGEKAHDYFAKSGLSKEQLNNIWNLADTQNRGVLDSIDFAIGMYFIRGVMNNKFSFIPTSLPAGLYHQAGGSQEPLFPVVGSSHTDQNHTQVSDIQNSRREFMGADSAENDLISLQVEKAEIEDAFLRDKEETRELNTRMIEMGKQVEALKADVERLKKEARQQKGLLAVARVQLSTKESEKAQAQREHAEAVEELSSIARDKDTVDAELAIMTSPEDKVAHQTLSFQSDSFKLASQPTPMTQDLSVNTTNEVFLEIPGSDLLPASSTFNSFSADQTTARVLSPAAVDSTDDFMTPSGPSTTEHDSDASLTHPNEKISSLGKLPDSHDKVKKPQARISHLKLVRPLFKILKKQQEPMLPSA